MKKERIIQIKEEFNVNEDKANKIYNYLSNAKKENNNTYEEIYKNYKKMHLDGKITTYITFGLIGVILLIIITNMIVNGYSTSKIKKGEDAFKIVENEKSSKEELQKAINIIEDIADDVDCAKSITKENKFHNFCVNSNEYIKYAKSKVIYNEFSENPSYDEYYNLYSEVSKILVDEDSNEALKQFKDKIESEYYNYLIDKTINGEYLKVEEITGILSGKKEVEFITNKYGATNICIGYSNYEFSNIYLFARSFKYDNINDKMDSWLLMSLKEDKDYNSKLIDYISNELINEKFIYNGESLTLDETKALLKNNLYKVYLNAGCDKLVSEGKGYIAPPQVGMTKEQVLNGKWGKPQKTNKTTTLYGTSEQWVYSGNRYVYFDVDGFVTSIQDY